MWVSDGGQQRLFAYDLAARDRLDDREIELAEGNSDARGIWSDGQPMWVLDGRAKSLFAYDLANCSPLAARLRQRRPYGIWSDGEVTYVADESDDKGLHLPTTCRTPSTPASPRSP